MEFPSMTSRLLHMEEDGFNRQRSLKADDFFVSVYNFYKSKGVVAIVLSELCSILSLAFTCLFSAYLMVFVNWTALTECQDEASCASVEAFLVYRPFKHTPTSLNLVFSIYFLLMLSFWIWKTKSSVYSVSEAFSISRFYRDKLCITLEEQTSMPWHQVVDKLIVAHNTGRYKIVQKEKLEINDVILRIMRRDNYLIALINKNRLDLFVPWWLRPFTTERLFFAKSMECSLSFCILDYMFTDEDELSTQFLSDVEGLQLRFRLVGIIQLILLPFMLLFMVIHFFLQNAQQFHSSRAYLGPRQWTPLALWQFREFNELSHTFEERINKAYKPCQEYLDSFRNSGNIIIARCLVYISGAIVGSLLLVSFISEGALLFVHIWDHNLLWYLGIFTAIFAGSRAMIPDEEVTDEAPSNLLQNVAASTHHFPERWYGREASWQVRGEVSELMQYKVQLFATEILSVILTPIVLIFSLPQCASSVIDFIRAHSRHIDSLGVVCDYSLFEFEKYGDQSYGSIAKNGYARPEDRLKDGKLEKSFINFQKTYPGLRPAEGSSASTFLHRFAAYKEIRKEQAFAGLTSVLDSSERGLDRSTANNQQFVHPRGANPLATSAMDTSQNDRSEYRSDDIDRETMGPFVHGKPELESETSASARPGPTADEELPKENAFGFQAPAPANPSVNFSDYKQENSIELSQYPQNSDYINSARKNMRTVSSTSQLSASAALDDIPSVLLSVLRQQNIDYKNDFYWLTKFHHDKIVNSQNLEQSIMSFQQERSTIVNTAERFSPPFLQRSSSDSSSPEHNAGLQLSGSQLLGDSIIRQRGLLPPWSPGKIRKPNNNYGNNNNK